MTVELERPTSDSLALRYTVDRPENLRLPPESAVTRADALWQHTCFELFVRSSGQGYLEFNFAPSREWAAYGFDDYRSGMTNLELRPPCFQAWTSKDEYELLVTLDLSSLHDRLGPAAWIAGVSAVLEHADGRVSYWALAHPPGKPDFHHPDSFVLSLPAPA